MKKSTKIIYWIATVWLVLGMVSTGVVQLLQVKTGAGGLDSMIHLGYPAYLASLLGIAKIAGAVVVLLPGLPLLKEWAYAGFFFVMLGALFSHLASGDAITETLPALLLLALTMVSWYCRPMNRKITTVAVAS